MEKEVKLYRFMGIATAIMTIILLIFTILNFIDGNMSDAIYGTVCIAISAASSIAFFLESRKFKPRKKQRKLSISDSDIDKKT